MIPALLDRSTEYTGALHTGRVEMVLSQLCMSSKSLLLNELESRVGGVPFDLLDWVYHVLVGYPTYVARHVFWHAPSSVLGDIQVIT